MKVVSVIGISKSGKTTTVEAIIQGLRNKRYTVGSVKDIHFEGFAIDTPGTNTDRHRQAGADLVTARGLKETDVLFGQRLPSEQILQFYTQDWVVMEGVQDVNAPKIVCAYDEEGIEKLLGPDTLAIAGKVANTGLAQFQGIPVLNALERPQELVKFVEQHIPTLLPDFTQDCCGLCGLSCQGLLTEIIAGNKQREDCILHQKVELKIGDKDITMVPFVQQVLQQTITALVSTLDGYQPHKQIQIKLDP